MSKQHRCPGCDAEPMGYIKAGPLSYCVACGKSFNLADFAPPAPPPPPDLADALETLRAETTYLVDVSDADHYSVMLFHCVHQICASLADKNQKLQSQVESLQRRVTHLQSKGLRGSTG